MIKNDVYYELFASKTVPNPDQVGYWIDLGANSKGKVIKLYNQDTEKWVKLTDATSEDAVAPFIGTNGNWWVDDRDTGVPAAGKNPYIGENNHWFIFDPLENEYIDTGIFAKGLSAYELAVKHGFEGTEEEWIASLSKASEEAAIIALGAAKRANEAADRADVATEKTEQAIDDAHAAADRNNEIANNPPKIVNEEWYVYDELTKEYKPTGVKAIGDAFSIKKEYPSVRAMEDDYDNPDILVGQFVIINTNNVEDPDDSKLYLKSIEGWKFVVDMSGARGIRGYSAYEVAVHNGFVGTEKEWVDSLSQDSKDAAAEALKAKEQVEETERQVKAAEAARVIAENNRVAAEEDRVDAEDIRIANENARKDAESKRVTAEEGRVAAENIRVSNENLRKSAETARENAEASRVSAESGRVSAENNRANQENARVASESARVENENNRKTAETARVNQENTRQSNETTRQTNETTRKNNENARIAAETKREQDTAAIIAATNTAKTEAEEATANANTQANRAKDYADHQPKIVARQWWVWDETIKDYKNTGIYATGEAGKSPIIQNDKWHIYNNTTGEYEDTGIYAKPTIIEILADTSVTPVREYVNPGTYIKFKNAIDASNTIILSYIYGDSGVSQHPKNYTIILDADTNAQLGIQFIIDSPLEQKLYFITVDDELESNILTYVEDNLISNDSYSALSANQGRILDEKKIDKSISSSLLYNVISENVSDGVMIHTYSRDTSTGNGMTGGTKILPATTTKTGVMSTTDKIKLDSVATGAEVNVQSDWTATDTNSDAYIKNKPNLATVATSGSYNDLSNKPTISSLSGIPLSQKGAANGVASLDSNGTVPASQLPSYVDDVIEYPNRAAFPATGESGKVYIAADTNITYRWSGSSYVVIGSDLALGETSSTAYPGDKGKQNADNIATINTNISTINTKFNNYSTTTQNDAKYLKLTGGTMTDRIHFNSTTPDNRFIDFKEENTYLGSIGIDENGLILNNAQSKQLHIKNTGALLYGADTIWHAGNDGSGSGLDADTVDGKHASNFIPYYNNATPSALGVGEMGYAQKGTSESISSGGPFLSFGKRIYSSAPEVFQLQADLVNKKTYIRYIYNDVQEPWTELATLDSKGKVLKAIDSDKFAGRLPSTFANFSGRIIADDWSYQTMGYGQATDGWKFNGPAISFGNGDTTGKYVLQMQMDNDSKSIWTRSINGSTVNSWKEFAFLDANGKVVKAITSDSATKLVTARTLWGQSFDGTGNVSGNMTNVGSITSSGEISTSSIVKSINSSSAQGGFFRVNHPGASWNNGVGAYNVSIANNDQQTPLLLAYKAGTTDYAGANRVFAMELINNGQQMRFAFNGVSKYQFYNTGLIVDGTVTATKFIGTLQGNADSATTATTANAVAWNNVTSKPTWIGATKPTYTAAEVGALASNGTAVAATKLATARTINGVSFDGTSNITITAAANGGNSATVGGYSNSAILVTRAAAVNVDSTDSTWNATYNPSSGGTKPTSGYGLVTQFNNVQGGAPGNGGVYVSQLGFDTDGSVRYRNRYDTSAWSTWKQFIFKGDSIPFSNINNITSHSNEFNVVDDGYTDGSNQLLWFNYRRLSGSGKIPIIAFGTADGIGSYATLQCNGVDAQSTIITPGYITTTGNWFQVDKSGCGLYHSTHNIRLMGTGSGWQLESSVHCPGGFFKDSDVRLKSNIKPLSHTLEQILAIPTCSFDMDGKNQIGTIAQEIEKDFPYLISEGIRNKNTVDPNYDWEVVKIPEGDKEVDYVKVKNVAYEQMSILNLEAIKLLNEKIEKLTSKVTELEAKLSKYE